jgi:hypothetical protein
MGERARSYILQHCSRERTAVQYLGVLKKVVEAER